MTSRWQCRPGLRDGGVSVGSALGESWPGGLFRSLGGWCTEAVGFLLARSRSGLGLGQGWGPEPPEWSLVRSGCSGQVIDGLTDGPCLMRIEFVYKKHMETLQQVYEVSGTLIK